jgi:transposase
VRVVAAATSAPPYPESTWSHQRIARHLPDLGISASQIGRILADCDLRPYRVRGWLTRKDDPLFWTRAADICNLYLHPPVAAVVLSIDEKTAIAARSRRHPGLAPAPGRAARQEFEYIRHGTVSIVAALNVRTGEVLTETITRNDSVTFQTFLTMLDASIDPATPIHAVLDNGSSHAAKATRAWLAAHPRWHVHWTPVHASWLNQIELYFSGLTRRVVRHGDFSSRTDLIDKIETYVIDEEHHRQALPMDLRWNPTQGRMTPTNQRGAARPPDLDLAAPRNATHRDTLSLTAKLRPVTSRHRSPQEAPSMEDQLKRLRRTRGISAPLCGSSLRRSRR